MVWSGNGSATGLPGHGYLRSVPVYLRYKSIGWEGGGGYGSSVRVMGRRRECGEREGEGVRVTSLEGCLAIYPEVKTGVEVNTKRTVVVDVMPVTEFG